MTRRAWNSTLPAPTKRIERKTKLAPAGATKRKKRARYDAFMASREWQKIRTGAIRRAGYRCAFLELLDGKWRRCRATTELHVHHKTYARFGGQELPSDLIVYCKTHHELVETTQFPHRRRGAA